MGVLSTGLKIVFSAGGAMSGLLQTRKATIAVKDSIHAMNQAVQNSSAAITNMQKPSTDLGDDIAKLQQASNKHNITMKQSIEVSKLRSSMNRVEIQSIRTKQAQVRIGLAAQRLEIQKQREGRREQQLTIAKIRTAISVMKEFRLVIKGVGSAFSFMSRQARATRSVARNLNQVRTAVGGMGAQFGTMFAVVGGGLAGLVGARGLSSLNGLSKAAIRLAGEAESAKLTFDTLLGDANKSQDLMDRITKFSASTPFQRSDIIGASKRMLTVTKDNVDENERLFKLASNIAALRPGRTVEDVARGIVGATVGEFEILKGGFGLVMRAADFKDLGRPGGTAYAEGVIQAIEQKFGVMTGGRGNTLVEKLSTTLTGRTSTLVDNMQLLGESLGTIFVESFGLKDFLGEMIGFLRDFGAAIRAMAFGKDTGNLLEIDPTTIMFAQTALDVMFAFIGALKSIHRFGKLAFHIFKQLNETTKAFITKLLIFTSATLAGTGLMVPILGTIGILAGGMMAIIMPLAGVIIPTLKAAVVALGIASATTAPAFAFLALSFQLFRKEGESVTDTVKKFVAFLAHASFTSFALAKTLTKGFIEGFMPSFHRSIKSIMVIIDEMRGPFQELMGIIFGETLVSTDAFSNLGFVIGSVLGGALELVSGLGLSLLKVLRDLTVSMEEMNVEFGSDIANTIKALGRLLTFTGVFSENIKTLFFGLADIILAPIRRIVDGLLEDFQETLFGLATSVSGISPKLTAMLNLAGSSLTSTRKGIREGLLATDLQGGGLAGQMPSFDLNLEVAAKIDQPVTLDGDKIGQNQLEVDMRARHAGRGGDPVNPEELGFVINNEGSSIKSVGLDGLEFMK